MMRLCLVGILQQWITNCTILHQEDPGRASGCPFSACLPEAFIGCSLSSLPPGNITPQDCVMSCSPALQICIFEQFTHSDRGSIFTLTCDFKWLLTWCDLQGALCFPQLLDSLQKLSATCFLEGVSFKTNHNGSMGGGNVCVAQLMKDINKHCHVLLTYSVFQVHFCICWVNDPLHLNGANFAEFTLC